MSESKIQQNVGKPNDEIDIFEFSIRIWKALMNFLIGIRDFIISILIFLIRKSLWIISFGIVGVLLGYFLYGISRPFYTSALEGSTGGIYDAEAKKYTSGVDNSLVIDHINKLAQVIHKPLLLANYLGLSVGQAEKIRSINAYYGIDVNKDLKPDYVDENRTYNPKDTTQIRVPSFIHIRVSVYDEQILPELRKGLFRYINSNAYIQELFKVDRRQKEERVKELEKEINKVNDFQDARTRKESSIEKGAFLLYGNEAEPRLFYRDVLWLHNQKQMLEKSLEISDEIIVVTQELTPLENEERPVLIYIVTLGSLMATLGLVCALFWQYRKKIWKLITEDSSK